MSDEHRLLRKNVDDLVDGVAETERDPTVVPSPPPSCGAALSVLWWRESDTDKEEEQKPETD